jgi:hypothetical protein
MGTVIIITLLLLLSGLAPFQAAADVLCDNLKVVTATLPRNTSSLPVYFAPPPSVSLPTSCTPLRNVMATSSTAPPVASALPAR